MIPGQLFCNFFATFLQLLEKCWQIAGKMLAKCWENAGKMLGIIFRLPKIHKRGQSRSW